MRNDLLALVEDAEAWKITVITFPGQPQFFVDLSASEDQITTIVKNRYYLQEANKNRKRLPHIWTAEKTIIKEFDPLWIKEQNKKLRQENMELKKEIKRLENLIEKNKKI